MESKECPFCGAEVNTSNIKEFATCTIGTLTTFSVYCEECSCSGPEANSTEEAVTRWNSAHTTNKQTNRI